MFQENLFDSNTGFESTCSSILNSTPLLALLYYCEDVHHSMKNADNKGLGVVLLQIHYQPGTPSVFIPVERGKKYSLAPLHWKLQRYFFYTKK